jgi:pimeloyl-ACP methyl ester carboxylesterase
VRLRHRTVAVDGVRLHCVEAGDGPLVVLLHGFPEFWYSWRRQIRDLAAAGWRVLAPDQRGYNLSDRPADRAAYRMDRLVDDVVGLVRWAGVDRAAAVVGHDWGGAVAWQVARRRPAMLERLAVLNAPHPSAYRAVFRSPLRSPGQLLRSWYVLFFQLPRLPEAALRAFDFAALEAILRSQPVRPGVFSDDDIAAYKAALDRPGALKATIDWYRANLFGAPGEKPGASNAGGRVEVPTLVIWGERDRYLGAGLLDGLGDRVEDLRIERLPEASHWVQADAPEEVSRLLLEFLEEG